MKNAMDTLEKHRERRVGKKKNTLRASAKSIDHQFAVIAFGQQNRSNFWIRHAQPAQQTEIRKVAPRDQDYVGLTRLHKAIEGRHLQRDGRNLKVPPVF